MCRNVLAVHASVARVRLVSRDEYEAVLTNVAELTDYYLEGVIGGRNSTVVNRAITAEGKIKIKNCHLLCTAKPIASFRHSSPSSTCISFFRACSPCTAISVPDCDVQRRWLAGVAIVVRWTGQYQGLVENGIRRGPVHRRSLYHPLADRVLQTCLHVSMDRTFVRPPQVLTPYHCTEQKYSFVKMLVRAAFFGTRDYLYDRIAHELGILREEKESFSR